MWRSACAWCEVDTANENYKQRKKTIEALAKRWGVKLQ